MHIFGCRFAIIIQHIIYKTNRVFEKKICMQITFYAAMISFLNGKEKPQNS